MPPQDMEGCAKQLALHEEFQDAQGLSDRMWPLVRSQRAFRLTSCKYCRHEGLVALVFEFLERPRLSSSAEFKWVEM